MLAFAEQLALPVLATIWIGAVGAMALLIFRVPKLRSRLEEPSNLETSSTAAPNGPLTAAQRTALTRRRRLAR